MLIFLTSCKVYLIKYRLLMQLLIKCMDRFPYSHMARNIQYSITVVKHYTPHLKRSYLE